MFAYAIDSPGNGLLQTRVRAPARKGNEVRRVGRPADRVRAQAARPAGPRQHDRRHAASSLPTRPIGSGMRWRGTVRHRQKRLRGTPASMRKPTRFEQAAAQAYGLPGSALSAFPNGAKARRTALGSFMGAVSEEMETVGSEAIDRSVVVPSRTGRTGSSRQTRTKRSNGAGDGRHPRKAPQGWAAFWEERPTTAPRLRSGRRPGMTCPEMYAESTAALEEGRCGPLERHPELG